jgi:GTP-dependent phosphoenolpyruvate carboxykinase
VAKDLDEAQDYLSTLGKKLPQPMASQFDEARSRLSR